MAAISAVAQLPIIIAVLGLNENILLVVVMTVLPAVCTAPMSVL